MEDAAKGILRELNLPNNIALLLELYGMRTISDLTSLDDSVITEVVECVRNGTFAALVDLEVIPNRIRYLGFNYKSLSTFNFPPFDLKKLRGVSYIANERLNAIKESKAKIKPTALQKPKEVQELKCEPSIESFDNYGGDDNTYMSDEELAQSSEVTAVIKLEDGTEIAEVDVPVLTIKSKSASPNKSPKKKPTVKPATTTTQRSRIRKSNKIDRDEGLKFRITNGVKYYICTICGKDNIPDRSQLKSHLLSHSSERNFVCEICSRAYKKRGVLLAHMKKHSDKFFLCDLCPSKYKLKHELRLHIHATHLKKRDHICHLCGKAFGRDGSLKTHLKIHSGVRTDVCQVCGFKAFNKAKLERHMKTHTGERNFACSLCGKLFLYSYNVTAHIRHVHYKEKRVTTSEQKLTCYLCNHKFPKIWKLKEHMEHAHNITS